MRTCLLTAMALAFMAVAVKPKGVILVKDYHGNAPGGLTRDPNGKGVYSPTGVWGDATLATREKGRIVTEAMVKATLDDIDALRIAPLP